MWTVFGVIGAVKVGFWAADAEQALSKKVRRSIVQWKKEKVA